MLKYKIPQIVTLTPKSLLRRCLEQLQDILILFAIIFQIYHHDNTLIDIKTEKGSINH